MPEFNNTFISGSMNKDLDERLMPKNQYRDALNIDVNVSKGEDAGVAKNKMGNSRVVDIGTLAGFEQLDEDTAKTIGCVEYEAFSKIYWFVAGDLFDGIYEYDEPTGIAVRVLQSNKLNQETPSKLNFRKEFPITGVNFIRGNDENNYLYWTDNYNPPRRINITRVKSDPTGTSGYQIDDPRIDKDIDVVLEPPLFAPSIYLYNDLSVYNTNNISEKFLYFSYRYKYVDDQYSSMSPFSAVAFMPKSYNYDYGVGNNKSMTNFYNSVKLTIETGNEFVKEIQVFVKDTKNINTSIIDTISKSELQIPDDSSYTISFNNNKVYAALPNDQVTRLYDNVPLLAKSQDIVGNRLAYGNYVQFRNIVDCFGNDININYTLTLKQSSSDEENPKSTWRSDRDYEIGLVYLDKYGRMSTVLTAPPLYPSNLTGNTTYIPSLYSDKSNTIVLSIKNNPPCWATHYRVYVKQSKKSYYNVFPIISYTDNLFKYFLINESDASKIQVGEYVIFKSISSGPTYSNKKYKILEIEVKPEGFVSNAIAGLYFKIKIDTPNELSGSNVDSSSSTGIGGGAVTPLSSLPIIPMSPFTLYQTPGNYPTESWVERPIFYGSGNSNGISLPNTLGLSYAKYYNDDNEDTRITIQIDSPTTYSVYKNSINKYTLQNNNVLIESDIPISEGVSTNIAYYFNVIFNQSTYNVGDRWIFNCRASFNDIVSQLGHVSSNAIVPSYILKNNCAAVIPSTWLNDAPPNDKKILTGALIRIQVVEDTYNPGGFTQPEIPFPPSPQDYDNIEEWWYESGARNLFNYIGTDGQNKKGSRVVFRRGKNWQLVPGVNTTFNSNNIIGDIDNLSNSEWPVRMFIFSDVPANPGNDGSTAASFYSGPGQDNNKQNKLVVNFKITQQQNLNICETSAIEDDSDIYHELFQTYPIVDGKHIVLWHYNDFQFADGEYTKLVQFDKTVPHYFNVGDKVNVVTEIPGLNDTWTVTQVPDLYTIVIDAPWPGSGPETPGTVSFFNTEEQDQDDATTPAKIEINKPMSFNTDNNGWSWGNGLESDRIYDDFNQTTKGFSVRVQVPIENYKQIRNEASICYSGVYQYNTALNRLNEFNLSLSNFKYLDRDFGSIQKLYARDTDLLVFQENKISNVLYGKNVMFDSIGGGQIVTIPEVLGTQIPMSGEWGISKNPESFAKYGTQLFFTDARRGVVLRLSENQIDEISSYGLNDYFRDLMKDNPTTQKIGAYDPYDNMYVLSTNEQRVLPCILTINREKFSVPKNGPLGYYMFSINTDIEWELSLVDTGYGTEWVTDYPSEGSGSKDINATVSLNNTGLNRTVKFEVTYCDGLKAEFILTQARGRLGKVIVMGVSHSGNESFQKG
jgi:hypothetical protein